MGDIADGAGVRTNPFLMRPYQLEQQVRRETLIARNAGVGPLLERITEKAIAEFFAYDYQARYNEIRAHAEEQGKFSGGNFETRLSIVPAF